MANQLWQAKLVIQFMYLRVMYGPNGKSVTFHITNDTRINSSARCQANK